MKKCKDCGEIKPVDCFNVRTASKDGLQYLCRLCEKEYNRSDKRKAVQAKYNTKIPPGVYQILNKQTGKRYIGESVIPNGRRKDHWTFLKGGKHYNPNLQQDYNKYGEDAFEFEMIEHCEPSQLKQREAYWINKHKDKCYNIK